MQKMLRCGDAFHPPTWFLCLTSLNQLALVISIIILNLLFSSSSSYHHSHQPQPARFGDLHRHLLHLHQHNFHHHLHHLHQHHQHNFHHHLYQCNHYLLQYNCHPTPPLHHHHPYQPQPARFGNRLLCFFSDFIMFIIFNGLS